MVAANDTVELVAAHDELEAANNAVEAVVAAHDALELVMAAHEAVELVAACCS